MSAISESSVGALCALLSAGTWALVSLLVRRLAGSFNSVTINAIRATGGGVLLLVWVLATAGTAPLRAITAYDFFLLTSSVIVAGCLGDTVFFESSRFLGLARAMVGTMTNFHDQMHIDDPSVLARTMFVDTQHVKATDFDLDEPSQDMLFTNGERGAGKFLSGWDFERYVAEFRSDTTIDLTAEQPRVDAG